MKQFSFLVLILYAWIEVNAQEVSDKTLVTVITNESFTDWYDARNHCISLGGDLIIPKPNSTDLLDVITLGVDLVWVGGRTVRVWIKDNSTFYFGNWLGCINKTSLNLDFRPATDLSACLQRCSAFKYAYVYKSLCCCSNETYTESKQNCIDPYNWAPGHETENGTHKFDMRSKDNIVDDTPNCWAVRVTRQRHGDNYSYIFNVLKRSCRSSSRCQPLCQTENNTSSGTSLPYGRTFLWTSNWANWDSAQARCEKEGVTLAKIDWQSPLFSRRLYHGISTSRLWLGLDRIRWRFIDGDEVITTWPEFEPSESAGCLVWGSSGLMVVSCTHDTPIQVACNVPQEITTQAQTTAAVTTGTGSNQNQSSKITTQAQTTPGVTAGTGSNQNQSSGVSIGVGVTVGVLAAVGVTLIVLWRIRKKSQQSDKPSKYLERNQRTNEGYGVMPSQLNTSTGQPEQGHSYEQISLRRSHSAVPPGTLYSQPSSDNVAFEPSSANVIADTETNHRTETNDDPYNKLAVPKASGPPSGHDDPPPAYSVVSLDADSGYVNCSDIAVTSPYDHTAVRGSPRVTDNTDYDQLDITNVRRPLEADTSSLYNRLTREDFD